MDRIIPDNEKPPPQLPTRKSTVFQAPIDAVARTVRKISSQETMAGRNYDSLRDNDRATVTMGDTVDGPMRVAFARPQNGGVANAGYIHDETVAPQPGVLLMSDNINATPNPGRKVSWNVRKSSAVRRPEIVVSPAELAQRAKELQEEGTSNPAFREIDEVKRLMQYSTNFDGIVL